jgi:hypothetical protein
MCNCGKRAAAAVAERSVPKQAAAAPVTGQAVGVRALPVIHDPALWGPHMWTALHTLSTFVSFDSARAEWMELLTHLAASLPCPECAGHYAAWLASHPLVQPRRRSGAIFMMRLQRVAVATGSDIATWLLDLHNAVNGQKTGVGAWTLDAMTATYGGDVGARRDAVRVAIDAVRGMIGARAIGALEALLRRM